MAIAGHGVGVLGLGAVELGAFPEHLLDAEDVRAVRVAFLLALGVVLAVDGRPLLGDHAGGHPEPETEEVRCDRVQIEGAVRGMAVQVDRHTGDGDVREHQRDQHDLPPARTGHAVDQEVHHAVEQRGKGTRVGSGHRSPIRTARKRRTSLHTCPGQAGSAGGILGGGCLPTKPLVPL